MWKWKGHMSWCNSMQNYNRLTKMYNSYEKAWPILQNYAHVGKSMQKNKKYQKIFWTSSKERKSMKERRKIFKVSKSIKSMQNYAKICKSISKKCQDNKWKKLQRPGEVPKSTQKIP